VKEAAHIGYMKTLDFTEKIGGRGGVRAAHAYDLTSKARWIMGKIFN
jgi:hypothetical protein